MHTLENWSIPVAAIIMSLGASLTAIFTYLRSCKRDYILDLEKRVANLELEVIKLIGERDKQQERIDDLTNENHAFTIEVLELRRRLNGMDQREASRP